MSAGADFPDSEDFADEDGERDPFEEALGECGQTSDGDCLLAGTEYCDFECPFRDEL